MSAKKESSQDVLTISLAGDVQLCVPNDISLMTPYILLEQEDWFEDEIKFVRKLLKPGMKVIDIGANYGTYSMNIAKLIGGNGKLWAFEPSSFCRSYLAKSIEVNGFNNIVLSSAGLSDTKRKAILVSEANTELGHVASSDSEEAHGESIDLETLDNCMQEYDWTVIDFIKMDAEGEEANILKGSQRLLNELSPLVMYEYKHGIEVNESLISDFGDLGYESYKLIPGLDILVPLQSVKENDGFLLNLFCCKSDCAVKLESKGFLIREFSDEVPQNPVEGGWRKLLVRYPYGKKLINALGSSIAQNDDSAEWRLYRRALDLYAHAANKKIDSAIRYRYLKQAFVELEAVIEKNANFSILQTYVRVATSLGERSRGTHALSVLVEAIVSGQPLSVPYPFITVSERYQEIDPKGDLEGWVKSSILETYEKVHAYSSYYTNGSSLELLEGLVQSPFVSPEIERRKQLIGVKRSIQNELLPAEVLKKKTTENKNPGLWVST